MGKVINLRLVSPSTLPNESAFISNDGKEIPITEYMIQRACKRLENSSFQLGAFLFNQANQSNPAHLHLV